MSAKGLPVSLEALRPPSVPDEQNFFKAPGIAEVLIEPTPPDKPRRSHQARPLLSERLREVIAATDAFNIAKPLNVIAIRDRLIKEGLLVSNAEPAAAAILRMFEPVRETLAAVQQAARERTRAAAPRRSLWEFSSLDAVATYDLAKVLALRGRIAVASGQWDAAFEDTLTLLQLGHIVAASQPRTLLQTLVAEAIAGRAVALVTDALPAGGWNGEQLARLQREIAQTRWMETLNKSLQDEHVIGLAVVDAASASDLKEFGVKWRWFLSIPGWREQTKATMTRMAERWFAAIDAGSEQIDRGGLEALRKAERDIQDSWNPYGILTRMLGAQRSAIVVNYAADVDTIREGFAALALERFRREHGRYPDSIDELVSAGLLPAAPMSAITGEPLRLTLLSGGGFELATTATGDKRRTLTITAAKAPAPMQM